MSANEILTVTQMRAADTAAVARGATVSELMERAGRAVADAVSARYTYCPTAVLCGPGDNGGDGYVAARILRRRGWPVWVEELAPPQTPAAQAAAARWRGETLPLSAADRQAGLLIDALFGAGLSRPLAGPALSRARASEGRHRPVVAVDVPSGLDGDTGRPVGDVAFHADLTVTFHRKKPAHVLATGRAYCGEVVVADIGLGDAVSNSWENTPALWAAKFPWPTPLSHKHARGRLIVVGGDAWSTGAARLAARAGLRIGAGLVTVMSPPDALMVYASHLEAVMLKPFESDLALETAASDVDAAVIGPAAGVDEDTVNNVLALARTGAALVLDADALTVFRDDPDELFSALDRDDILTPHAGEFERLFPGLLRSSPERITAVREAARLAGSVVLLKGPDTAVAAPDGRVAVATNAAPWLATAGSGDVLAGFIGGLAAQGMDSFEAACAGAWIHGEAGAAFGPGLTAEDLPGLAPPVLRRLYEARPQHAAR